MTPEQELQTLLINFKKRLIFLEKSAFDSKEGTTTRNNKLESENLNNLKKIKDLKKELDNIQTKINKMNSGIKHSIEIIKQLAHKTDLNKLNENSKEMKFDELLNEKELRLIVEQRMNQ